MANFSTHSANNILNLIDGTTWTLPAGSFFSFHTDNPGGTGANEVSAGWYGRKTISWNSDSGSGATNNGSVAFNQVTGAGVTVKYIGIWDAVSGGNFIWYVSIGEKTFPINAIPTIPNQGVTVTATGAFSSYLGPNIINHMLGISSFTAPTPRLAHYTAAPTTATSNEASGGSYARQSIAHDAASGGSMANTSDVNFPTATADVSSGSNLTHGGLCDAASAGNLLISWAWDAAQAVLNTDDYRTPAAGLTVTAS